MPRGRVRVIPLVELIVLRFVILDFYFLEAFGPRSGSLKGVWSHFEVYLFSFGLVGGGQFLLSLLIASQINICFCCRIVD